MFDHGGKGREKVDNEVAADGESKRQMPAISLPKGGGSMRGIGEKFSVNAVNGTASISMPIAATPGRSGFGPQLSLSYNSGAGNGPFGLGWNLSIPSITRKTDKGLPRYQDTGTADSFILSDAEDLVPCLAENDQEPEVTGEDGRTYFIRRYRPRIEGLFARIERRVDKQTGDTHWQSVSKDNITTVYGRSPECRLADPRDKSHVFSWLIEESYDDKGNVIIYEYKQEDRENIDQSQPQEKNRLAGVFANRHIKRIKYGNKQPYQRDDWLFQVVFDYGDHHPDISGVDPDQTWACRQDPFSAYRAGFEIRTYRLCRRVLMFHHFAELGDNPCLVRSTDFGYRPDPVVTGLTSVVQVGYVRDENGLYRKKTLPPVEFSYTGSKMGEEIHSIEPESLENLPVGLDGAQYQWLDLESEGVAGILSEQAGAWFYKSNLGNGRFAPEQVVSRQPALANLNGGLQQIMDLAGNGHKYLVQFSPPLSGYYERTGDGDWDSFTPFQSLPNIALNDLNLKFIDLTGDGFADILISEDEVFVWYPSRGRQGFGPSEVVRKLNDEEQGPALVFSDANQSIHLADMSGDGLVDLIRIRNGQVCYWPNLGYGRFGAKVEMAGAPWFDCPDQFNPGRIRLADVDGSGPTDIIYLGRDSITIWFNQAGNSWSEQNMLRVSPAADNLAAVSVVDLMGNGTACLVWSSPLPGDRRRPMRYIDLMGGVKPHLLKSIRNNLGAETWVQYAASTRFYLEDRAAGRPWVTKLPFPVQVVERVEIYDRIGQNHFVTRYAYHHGYYDGVEREFRGFGLVEQWDTEEFTVLCEDVVLPPAINLTEASHVPPVYTKTWFHTGAYFDGTKVARHFETEYYREPDLTPDQFRAMLLDDTVLPAGLSVEEERQACRALKGSVLRQEVYAEDNSVNSRHPYTVSEHNYHVRSLQPQAGGNPYAVFFVHLRETVNYHYEREIIKQDPNDSNSPTVADPRVSHQIILKVDQYGNVRRSVSIGYPRRAVSGRRPEQEETHIAFTVGRFANCADQQDWYRIGLPVETRTYEIVKPPQPSVTSASAKLFTFQEMQILTEGLLPLDQIEPDPAKNWPYEKWDWRKGGDIPPEPRLRLVEHVRTLYRRNDLTGPLPLGEAESLALPYDSYKLAFTPDLLTQVFGSLINDALMQGEGKYVHCDSSGDWWIPSGQVFYSPGIADTPGQELAFAKQHFFLPHRYLDPFGYTTSVDYDPCLLMITRMTDPVGNMVQAENDYRVMQPRLVTDPNGNRSEVAFDAMGLVAGTAVMGKAGENKGDSLVGFKADLDQSEIDAFFSDPYGTAGSLLGAATTRVIYDPDCFVSSGQPVFAAVLARETHAGDPVPSGGLKIQVSFGYSDGFGREIQKKIQAEAGPVPTRDADGKLIMGADGRPMMTAGEAGPRWVGSGWTVFNNKGKPVRQYEPFFTDTHRFEFEVKIGVTPILFYDPIGRVIATLHPDHTYQKVVFNPWRQITYDVNDTVAGHGEQTGDPRTDPDIAGYTTGYFATQPTTWQTWHMQRQGGALGPHEQAAANKAAAHADTPATTYFDALGRPFLTVAHNRVVCPNHNLDGAEDKFHTRVELDIEGNQRAVRDSIVQNSDAPGRIVVRYDYDILGNRIHQAGMEAGEGWMLGDVAGNPVRTWDSRGFRHRVEHDVLRRPTALYVSDNGQAEFLAERTVYGDTPGVLQNPEQTNHRGRTYRVYDSAGVVTCEAYDFKGNLLRSSCRLCRDYKQAVDWQRNQALEEESFHSRTFYDALNRPIQIIAPHSDRDGAKRDILRPGYNEANLLERIDAWLRQADEPEWLLDPQNAGLHVVSNIDYNVKGQRIRIQHGNGTVTSYEYDPLNFRLIRLHTTRPVHLNGLDTHLFKNPGTVQDLRYTYDPAGNITHIAADALPVIYHGNQAVEPNGRYTYDALYRLIEARGREHIGQSAFQFGLSNGNCRDYPFAGFGVQTSDPQAVRNYTERYVYDAAGNFLSFIHQAGDGNWQRDYAYEEPSLLTEPGQAIFSNRLTRTILQPNGAQPLIEPYDYDAHGNMIRMPHLPLMQWDFKGQLSASSRQERSDGGTPEITYYVYNGAGRRVRKVTERQAAAGKTPTRMKERLYLGGFEIYREYDGSGAARTKERETLHIMDDQQRIALVETTTFDAAGTDDLDIPVIRYQLGNHLGSAGFELDRDGAVISYEEYHPYGTTSYQAGRSLAEISLKRYRYTGQERDEETGLNYHGARYYMGWLGRWISCDPLGTFDGNNLYEYVLNNPISFRDVIGTQHQAGTSNQELHDATLDLMAPYYLQLSRQGFQDLMKTDTGKTALDNLGLPYFNYNEFGEMVRARQHQRALQYEKTEKSAQENHQTAIQPMSSEEVKRSREMESQLLLAEYRAAHPNAYDTVMRDMQTVGSAASPSGMGGPGGAVAGLLVLRGIEINEAMERGALVEGVISILPIPGSPKGMTTIAGHSPTRTSFVLVQEPGMLPRFQLPGEPAMSVVQEPGMLPRFELPGELAMPVVREPGMLPRFELPGEPAMSVVHEPGMLSGFELPGGEMLHVHTSVGKSTPDVLIIDLGPDVYDLTIFPGFMLP